MTNSAGALVSQQRYLPFGGLRNIASGPIVQTDYGYTGQRNLDHDIGLMDYKARFYSPVLNRFIQPDSIVPNPYNPQAYNRFSYVYNRPIIFIDPSGHDPWWCENSGCTSKWIQEQKKAVSGWIKNMKLKPKVEVPNGNPVPQLDPTPSETPAPPENQLPLDNTNDDTTAPENTVCITPMPGSQNNCFVSDDPGFGFTIGFKDWEDIDKIDLTVDGLGIFGDGLKYTGGPGVVAWFGTEVLEYITISRSFDQMEAGNPDAGIGIIVDTAITVAQYQRLAPAGGWVGNIAGIALNVLEIKTIP